MPGETPAGHWLMNRMACDHIVMGENYGCFGIWDTGSDRVGTLSSRSSGDPARGWARLLRSHLATAHPAFPPLRPRCRFGAAHTTVELQQDDTCPPPPRA